MIKFSEGIADFYLTENEVSQINLPEDFEESTNVKENYNITLTL